jgi:hypothetical protein
MREYNCYSSPEQDPEIEDALKAEFERGQAVAEAAIISWLQEVGETMHRNGDDHAGVVGRLERAIKRGEWKS